MLVIFNVEPPIGDDIPNGIIKRWIRVGINELFLVPEHSPLLLPLFDILIPLDTFSPILLLFFQLFGFIITYALNYISFAIAPMNPNFSDKLILITTVTNKIVIVTHFTYGDD